MKKILLLFFLIVGICESDSQSLSAQTGQEQSITNKYFIGGFLTFRNQDLEGFPVNSLLVTNSFGTTSVINTQLINGFRFNTGPYLGLRIGQNKSVGVTSSFQIDRQEYISTNNSNIVFSSLNFSVGGFYRNDFRINDKLIFFLQSNIFYLQQRNNIIEDNEKQPNISLKSFNAFANVGARVRINEKWSLLSSISTLGYRYQIFNSQVFFRNSFNHVIEFGLNLRTLNIGLERSF